MARTYPGKNPELILDHFSPEERTIISKFSSQWYITNGGGNISLGPTSSYKYFLMKPPDNLQEMFNIEREIVVVFSPYEKFEPRTLDAVDWVLKKYQKLRLEKICRVVISKDDSIRRKLTELLQREPESPIVIPFSYSELLAPTDDYFFRNRFKNHFYTRDLFAFESPLKTDLYFFGRNDLVHKLVNRHKANENSGLFGLRKSGKTSVIFGVERALLQTDGKLVFIDCQNPAVHRRRWFEVLYYVLAEVMRQLGSGLALEAQASFTEKEAPIKFEHKLMEIHNELGKHNILIVFDEIENITFNISPSQHWKTGGDFVFFWQTLRSLSQKLDRVFSYMVVGTNPLCIEVPSINGVDNPIFNHFPYEYIPGFTADQTREMVRRLGRIMGLRFADTIYSKLAEDYGGHPFLIRHVCSVINRMTAGDRPADISKTVYEKAKVDFNREYSNFIQMILNVLLNFYPDEYSILECLAMGDTEKFKSLVRDYPNYVNHLLGYGIVTQQGEHFEFQIEAVKDYLVEKSRYRRINLTKREMLSEISERRNALEPRLRRLVKTQLQARVGMSEAKSEVLKVFGNRAAKYGHLSYSQLFDANSCEIYFDDLRKIVIKNWEVFKYVFSGDKDDFDRRMRTVNKFRADAHAKDLSAEQMQYFRLCMSEIERAVEEFTT